jgi:hypothetical protein
LSENRHTRKVMPEIRNDKNTTVRTSPFLAVQTVVVGTNRT